MIRSLLSAAILLCPLADLQAQLATSLSLNKKTYVAGEPVIAEIIVTNHSGRELTLASSRALPWLSFVVTNTRGNPVPTRQLNRFGAMKIKALIFMAPKRFNWRVGTGFPLVLVTTKDNQGNAREDASVSSRPLWLVTMISAMTGSPATYVFLFKLSEVAS